MMNNEIKKTLAEAVRIANSLFARCKTSGTTANISFRCGDSVWISRSGSCFETLAPEDFVEVGLGRHDTQRRKAEQGASPPFGALRVGPDNTRP